MAIRQIVLQDKKLENLLKEKEDLIIVGREKSMRIEELEKEMEKIDGEILALEKEVNISDLDTRIKANVDAINKDKEEMEAIKKLIHDRMMVETDPEPRKRYEDRVEQKKQLEKERNKIALKAQQKIDRIIPLGRKLMKPHLQDEFDDYDSIRFENGEVVATIFNHVDELRERLNKKK